MRNKLVIINTLVLSLSLMVTACSSDEPEKHPESIIYFDQEIYGHWVVMPEETVKVSKLLFPNSQKNWQQFQNLVGGLELILSETSYQIIVNGKYGKKLTPEIIYSNVGLTIISDKELGIHKNIKKITANKIRVEMGLNQIFIYERKNKKISEK